METEIQTLHPKSESITGFAASCLQNETWNYQTIHSYTAYNHCLFKVQGHFPKSMIEHKLEELIRGHEILRTRLVKSPLIEHPVQVIAESSSSRQFFKVEFIAITGNEAEIAVKNEYREIIRNLVPLSSEVLKLRLYEFDSGLSWGILSVPALVSDGATIRSILKALFSSSTAKGQVEDSIVQYADLSDWLSESISSNSIRVSSAGSVFDPVVFRSESQFLIGELFNRVSATSARFGLTLSDFISRTWGLFLWGFERNDAFLFGLKTDLREQHNELVNALGPMEVYKKIPLRIQGKSKLIDILKQDIYSLNPAKEPDSKESNREILDLVEFYGLAKPQVFKDFGATIINLDLFEGNFRYKLEVEERSDSLSILLKYNSHLVSHEEAETTLSRYVNFLKQVGFKDEALVDEISPLSEIEQSQLLSQFNETNVAFENATLRFEKLFEIQAEKSPFAIALVLGERELTYNELNAAANRLARYLKKIGITDGDQIAILSDSSFDYVIQVLATQKLGASFMPLDIDYPVKRITAVLEQLRPRVVLTQEKFRSLITQNVSAYCRIVAMVDSPEIFTESAENINSIYSDKSLAYTIFTSGSSGKPKGVTISHRALVNFLLWMKAAFPLQRESKVMQMCSHGFDVSIRELFWPLISGASVLLTSPESRRDPEKILSNLEKHQITDLRLAPSLLNAMIETGHLRKCSSLERVFTGGEALSFELEKKYHKNMSAKLYNMYGPTETTINATYRYCDPSAMRSEVSIGRPIANTQIYLLNESFRPVPFGVRGEIFISGAGVSSGYFGDSNLSQSLFLPDPFKGGGQKMYKTGDYGRYLENGEIQFLGRNDQQKKLRGFRIEIGEIEQTLRSHPQVKDLAVQVVKNGEDELIAFVVVENPINVDDLKAYCADRLPHYMVPARFIEISGLLPTTLNGKIDSRALAEILIQNIEKKSSDSEPANELESLIILIWKKILGIKNLSPKDNYFNLGGDSIRTIQIVQELLRFGVKTDPMSLFKNPTPQLLARMLMLNSAPEKTYSIDLNLARIPLDVEQFIPNDLIYEDIYPASSMQEIILEHYGQGCPDAGVYHVQQVLNLSDPSGIDVESLSNALVWVVKGQRAFRTRFLRISTDSYLQVVQPPGVPSITVIDLQKHPEQDHEELIRTELAKDRKNHFSIENASTPLFRFYFFIKNQYEIGLCRSTHHAITDGWGKAVFFGKIVDAYIRFKDGFEPETSIEAQSHKEFIALEIEAAKSAEARSFWSSRLADTSFTSLEPQANSTVLPASFNLVRRLVPELFLNIRTLASEQGVSIKSVFLTAFYDVISSEFQNDKMRIGVVSNGRSHRMSNALEAVGLFWNLIPFAPRVSALSTAERIRATQVELVSMEQFANFPLKVMHEISNSDSLFFATFNFVHFHSVAERQFKSVSWELTNLHDKFHYPINFAVSVHPLNEEVNVRVEFDQRFFSEEAALLLYSRFNEKLIDLATVGRPS